MPTGTTTIWSRRKSKRTVDSLLLVRRINKAWLDNTLEMVSVRFGGTLKDAIADLRDAAKQTRDKQNLPIGTLRLMLQAFIDGVAILDKDLGCDPLRSGESAITMYRNADDDDAGIIGQVCYQMNRWYQNSLDPWAQRNNLGEMANRVRRAIQPENIVLMGITKPLKDPATQKPDFPLVARQIADQLIGETLFPGMGPCELVLPEYASSRTIELITPPRRATHDETTYSMVARISVDTVPYSDDLYFTISAAKRVWAGKAPDGGNTSGKAKAYVLAPNRPTIPVTVIRKKTEDTWCWDFADEYAGIYYESNSVLPATLDDAMQNLAYVEGQWWAGLPQITRLYRRVAPRTVFENDERDLLLTVQPLLEGVIEDTPPPFIPHPLELNGQPYSAMLKFNDLGVAGTGISEEDVELLATSDFDDDDVQVDNNHGEERARVVKFREQCVQVLREIHGDAKPRLWIVGGTEQEQRYIEKAAELLFGDAVTVAKDPLPSNVHDLRKNLPGAELNSRQRFEERIKAWQSSGLPAAIAQHDGPKFVLICAQKEYGRQSEDLVNRRAAIHAMCSIAKANIHHVLPIAEANTDARKAKAVQSFIHRAQSAMMDVMLAHSGYIIGAREFISTQLTSSQRPHAIYGIQALRKNAQLYSGETAVCLILYSRLVLETNVTEMRFVYKEGGRTERSPWMRLFDGLRWLGCHRLMQGDEEWLRREFQPETIRVLGEINAQDPRAIVLMDWQTLPRLWNDMTDASLTQFGQIRLGHADLGSAFPGMSFVRLRHGPMAVMTLRAQQEFFYEGFSEESASFTGELSVDSYATTLKQLIEINPPPAGHQQQHGHFIGVMGYRKTTQTLRGLSCYRVMPRKIKIKDGLKGFYRDETLDPADMDAALPAPIDITVMHAPSGVPLAKIATIVMGLRLGYAHYDDWTRLPAPLFFIRKIDDYIIKYPEGDGDAAPSVEIADEVVAEPVEREASTPVMQAMVTIVEKEAGPVLEASEVASESPANDDDESAPILTPETGPVDILERARQINMEKLLLFPAKKSTVSRLFECMIRGDIDIRVTLPFFVHASDLFGSYESYMKNRINKGWRTVFEGGYIPKRRQRPPYEQYFSWASSYLVHPQGAYFSALAILREQAIIIPPVQEIVSRYNETAQEPLQIDMAPSRLYIDLAPVTKSAIENNDDETLAWLIFAAAQTPAHGIAETVMPHVTKIIGDRSRAALHYFVACAEAIEQAFAQWKIFKPQNFPIIRKDCGFVPAVMPAAPVRAEVPAETRQTILDFNSLATTGPSPVIQVVAASPDIENAKVDDMIDNPVAQCKQGIRSLVDGITPGSDAFDGDIERISVLLERLKTLNAEHQAELQCQAEKYQRGERLQQSAEALLAMVHAVDEDNVLGRAIFTPPEADGVEQAEGEIESIMAIAQKVSDVRGELAVFLETPLQTKASVSEKVRHSQQVTRMAAAIDEQLATLKGALIASTCFSLVADGGSSGGSDGIEPANAPETPLDSRPEPVVIPEVKQDSATLISDSSAAEMPAAVAPEPIRAPVIDVTATPQEVTEPPPAAIEPISAQPLAVQQLKETPVSQPEVTVLPSYDQEVRNAFKRLIELIDKRNYALASVYVDAIRVAFGSDPAIDSQCIILSALCQAMESIDCNFAVDVRLNLDLNRWLQTHSVEANPYTAIPNQGIGVLAASLIGTLFSSESAETEDVRWTVIDSVRPPVAGLKRMSELIEHLATMDSQAIVLTREKFTTLGIGDKIALRAEHDRAITRAANWKKDPSIHSTWAHSGFGRIHEHIYGISHPIGQCLSVIAKGDFKYLPEAYEHARRKFEKPAQTIIEAFKACKDRLKPEGKLNHFACENIEITHAFIRECLVRTEPRVGTDGTLGKNDRDFLGRLHQCLISAIKEIETLEGAHPLDFIYTQAAAVIFKATLRLYDNQEPEYCIPEVQQRLLVQCPMDRDFWPSMRAPDGVDGRALCSAEYVMQSIEDLLTDGLATVGNSVTEEALLPLLGNALRAHLNEHRFLPTFKIYSCMRIPLKLEPSLIQQYQKTKAGLTRDLQDARQRVTHAMSLSALTQKEAAALLRTIESISASNMGDHAIGHPDGTSTVYPDFPHARAALRDHVLTVLDTRLKETRDKLLSDLAGWEEVHGGESPRDIARIRQMLETNNPANLRTAHDALTILTSGRKLPSCTLNPEHTPSAEFENFIRELDAGARGHQGMLDILLAQLRDATNDNCPSYMSHLDQDGRNNAIAFIQQWMDMCIERIPPRAAELIGRFFASIGIGEPDFMQDSTRNRHVRVAFPDKAFNALVNSDCFVPPALGSPANMNVIMGYMIPGTQPDNDIASLILDIGGTPSFIMARTRLTQGKRARLSGRAPAFLIDDNLIAYMALHPDERARRMMEIGTLTFYTQPYSADGTFVPKEMFFGRQRELDNLRQVKSLAVLYGGRRLGKSSLLVQVEREINRIPGNAAIYIPMNRDYHGGDHVLFAWRTLSRALASRGIIDPLPQDTNEWVSIRNWIEQQLTAPSQKYNSCYLLLDEADDLMMRELELKPGTNGLISSFHQMVESIQSKFVIRYVIAGLHNLTRMTTESNSALGKAETIALEPFSNGDDILRGIQLVTKPMAALGFYFAKGCEDLPLRILSLCNYYPAFIQVYCKKLLEHMYNKRQHDQAFAFIDTNDLDAVEKDHDLLTELQTKFGLTLDLDKRYKVIALILAETYYRDIETGKNNGLTVGEIRELCEVAAGAHFTGMSGGAYESLVDEMRKLNVLERNNSRYLLRNPSIAMLIGDTERIKHQLEVLAKEPPEKMRNHGDRRYEIIANGAHLFFPMPVAWTTSHMDVIDGGLVVFAGNNLTGLVGMSTVAPNTYWPITQNSYFRAINMPHTSVNTVMDKIKARLKEASHKGDKYLLASMPTSWRATDIPAYANQAKKNAAFRTRIALMALPDRLYEISEALRTENIKLNANWEVVPIPPWSLDAIRFHIQENVAVADNTDACAAILEASCGFGKQIQSICSGSLTLDAALRSPDHARQGWASSLDKFYEAIGWPHQAITAEHRKHIEEFVAAVYVDGIKRNSSDIALQLEACRLTEEDLHFLNWMGLLQEGDNNTWVVPKLYVDLIFK